MPFNRRTPVQPGPLGETQQDNDALTAHAAAAGVWGLPSEPADVILDVPAELPPEAFDYSKGMLEGVAGPDQANALGFPAHPHLLRTRTDEPRAFQLPHEATHRRFEPPILKPIVQAAAGYLQIAATNQGLHYIKVLALFLTLDAAGTIKFVQGSNDGTGTSDLTGPMAMGGAAVSPMVLSPAPPENPWLFTSSDQALGIFTVTGKAQGWAMVCYSPYDS